MHVTSLLLSGNQKGKALVVDPTAGFKSRKSGRSRLRVVVHIDYDRYRPHRSSLS